MKPVQVSQAEIGSLWAWIRGLWRCRRGWAFGLGLCCVLWFSAPQGVWPQTTALQVTVQGQNYAQMVEASRPQVWQALATGFGSSSNPNQVTVEVMGQQGSLRLPLLLVTMTREQWQTQPSPQQMEQFAQFYTSAIPLLTPPTVRSSGNLSHPPLSSQIPAPDPGSPMSIGELTFIGSQPAQQQVGVAINPQIIFEFDQPLDGDLETLQVSMDPPVELAFDVQGERLLVQPLQLLDYSTIYRVDLLALGDRELGEPLQITFRTEPQYTYERDIQPLLQASCVGCHQFSGRQRRQPLDSYGAVMAYVDPYEASSDLIDPQWTQPHARAQRQPQPQPGEDPPTPTNLETLPGPELQAGGVALPSSPDLTSLQDQPFTILTRPEARSPELGYVRRLGISEDRLGRWTPAEVERVRTWIIQDGAPEQLTSSNSKYEM